MKYHGFAALLLILLSAFIMIRLLAEWMKKRRRQREREERRRKKGEEGEASTALFLNKVWGYKRILHHVYVPKADGGTSEIDLVMIHERGIIVIENKNYMGYIYGAEEDLYWTQVIGRGERRSFYNPVKQNQTHIRYLRCLLAAHVPATVPYLSVVTFNNRKCLKRIRVDAEAVTVTCSRKVRRCLKKRLRRMPRVLERKQVDEICCFLQGETGDNRRNRKKHEKQMRRMKRFN